MTHGPRVILETDLPHDCGLIAAAAWKYLTSHGVKARILTYQWGKDKGHQVVVFESGNALASYDQGGTRTIHHATWKSAPKTLATAMLKADRSKLKVTRARWER